MIIKIQIISSFVGEKKRNHHRNDCIHSFKHKNTIRLLLVLFVLFVSTNHIWGQTQTYCSSSGNTTFKTSITRVILNTIDNTSAKPSGYSNYTSQSTDVYRNSAYNLSVYVNTDGNYLVDVIVWIDWNQNGDFTDSGESYDLGNATNQSSGSTSKSPWPITVPSTASYGNTRMRVSVRYNQDPTSCQTGFDGEVEDYSINVVTPGFTVTPTSLTGFTYAEDIGPSATQTFTASGASLTGNVTLTVDNSYYEISTNASSGFGSSLTLTPSGGTLASATIYVRLKAGLPVGTYNSQTITISSSGFTNKTVTCSGSVTLNPLASNNAFWYKADDGTSTTTSGSGISQWNDQSGNGNNAISNTSIGSTQQPKYLDTKWNFNPAVDFTNGSSSNLAYFRLDENGLGESDMTFYTVFSTTVNSSASISYWCQNPTIIGGEIDVADGSSDNTQDFGLGLIGNSTATDNGSIYFKAKHGNTTFDTPSAYNNGYPQIVTGTHKKSSSGYNYIYVNGTQKASETSDNYTLSTPTYVYLGTSYGNNGSKESQYQGYLCEAIGKASVETTKKRWVYESYLAIKYGVTLGVNYKQNTTASDSTIYTISGYAYDIAGLGRNNILGLNQKVSSSSNVTSGSARVVMATDNDFTSSNLSTSRTSLTNEQYLIWGHNNGTVGTWTAIASTSYSRVNRIWRVQNTSNVGTVNFQIDLTNFATLPSSEYCYVLIIGDPTFSTINSVYPLANTSGNLYTAQPTFPSGTYYFTIARVPNYWIGRNSTDWGIASNWTANFVPVTGQNIVYATTTNYGTVAQNDLILDQDRTVGNFTNATTKQLIIPAGKALTINGTATISSNPDLIQILANATQPNGSLIFTNPQLNTNVQATIQMYSKGCKVPTTTWKGGDGNLYTISYSWQYFGLPVQSATASPTFDGSWVREYSESKNGSTYYQKWTQLANSNTLSPFKGYEITQENAKTNVIQGKLVVSDATLNLTKSSGYGAGYNIFGNSYTAAIDISKINFPSSGVDKTVYLYNTASLSQWGGGSTYTAIPYNAAQIIGNEIPSMQGYLLIASAPCTVTIPYNATVSSLTKNTMPQKVKSIQKAKTEQTGKESSTLPYIKIEVNNDSTYDCAWIFDINGTSHDYDNGWDGYKLTGTQGTLIYSDEVSGKMQVNTLDNIDSVYLDFKANDRTNIHYTLNINSENIIEMYNDLYFKDLKTGASIKFDSKSITYHFTADNADEAEKRFLIGGVKKYSDGSNPFVVSQNYGRKIMIKNNGYENGKIYLYDTVGKTIAVCDCPAQDTVSIPYQLQQGIYITKIETQKGRIFTQKIVIK